METSASLLKGFSVLLFSVFFFSFYFHCSLDVVTFLRPTKNCFGTRLNRLPVAEASNPYSITPQSAAAITSSSLTSAAGIPGT